MASTTPSLSLEGATIISTPSPSPSITALTSAPSTFSVQPSSTYGATVTGIDISSNPEFVGYESVGMIDLTTIYSSANCPSSSTLYSSSNWATCCSGQCSLYTGCLSQSVLQGPPGDKTCSGASTCHMDFIYPSSAAIEAPVTAYYCAEYGYAPISYYRAQPSDGILSTNTSGINAAKQGQSSSLFGVGVGGGLGGLAFLLVLIALLWFFCYHCSRGRRYGRSRYPQNSAWPRMRGPVSTSGVEDERRRREWESELQERQFDGQSRYNDWIQQQQEDADRRRQEDWDRQQQAAWDQQQADADAERQRQADYDRQRQDDYNRQQQQDDYNNRNNNN